MKCFNCNSEIADNNLFCPLCGTNLVPNQNNNLEGINNFNQTVSLEPVSDVNNGVVSVPTEENIPTTENNILENTNPVVTPLNAESVSSVETSTINVSDQFVNNTAITQPNIAMGNNPTYNVGFKEESNPQLKGKSKTPFVIASILIIAILAFAGFFGFKFLSSPKKVFVGVLDKSSDFLSGFVDKRMYTSDTVSLDFDLNTTNKIVDEEMGPIFNIIKNISLNGKVQIDYKNKNMLMNLDSKYSNNELVNAAVYVTNEKLYFDLKDLYDKKLSTNIDGINEIFKINEYSNDIFNVVEEVKNGIKNSLKDEYFVKENIKMSVNGQESSVNKTVLLLNYKNLRSLLNSVLNNLKNNEKFLNSFVNLMKLEDEEFTKQDVIDEIDEFLEDINEEVDTPEGDIKIILYTKGFNNAFVGFAIEDNTSEYGTDFSIINDKENIYTLKINDGYDEQEAIIKVNGDVYTLELEEYETKIELGLNLKTYDCNMKVTSDEFTMTGSLKTDTDGKKNLNILYNIEGNEIGIDMSYIIKYNEVVTIPSLTPSVDIDSISSDDGKNILTKMLEKQGIQDLFKEVAEVSGYPIEGKVTIDDIFVSSTSLYDYNNSYNEMLNNA